MRRLRPAHLSRSWLLLEGANESMLAAAPASGADVLIQELEDFTPPNLRPKAHALAPDLYASWRAAGCMVGVRVNPLTPGAGAAAVSGFWVGRLGARGRDGGRDRGNRRA